MKTGLILRSKQHIRVKNRPIRLFRSHLPLKPSKKGTIFIPFRYVLKCDALCSLMLQIHARKIRKIDVHLTYSFIQLRPVQGTLGLHERSLTLIALYVEANSIKNLVTSPRSKIRMRVTVPNGENRAKTA